MNLTTAHAEFWRQRKGTPGWAKTLGAAAKVTIDSVINAHASNPKRRQSSKSLSNECAVHNMINIVRGFLKHPHSQFYGNCQGDVVRYLLALAANPGTIINPQKRQALARKWAARLMKLRGKLKSTIAA